jgi:hypothetical protein
MSKYLTFILTFCVLWRGGFQDSAWIVFGAICAIYLVFKLRETPPRVYAVPFILLAVLYAVSAFFHGGKTENLVVTFKVFAAFLWFVICCQERMDVSDAVFISGIAAALWGIAGFALKSVGLNLLPGTYVGGRLYGSFQYANTYALYLAVCAFLCHLDKRRLVRRSAFVMDAAILLTLSVGGIGVYALGWILYTWKYKRKIFVWMTVCIPLVAIAGYAVVGFRPLFTFLERLLQINDAIVTAAHNPLGIGPGAWEFEVLSRQTAFYDAVVVHSGYAAVAVDAGLPALAAAVALLVFYYANGGGITKHNIAATMILTHALFDFSLSFLAVTMLLCPIMVYAIPPGSPVKRIWTARRLCAIPLVMLFLLPFSRGTEMSQAERYQLQSAEHLREGDILQAAEDALRSVEEAPYYLSAYEWAIGVVELLPQEDYIEYEHKINSIRADAQARKNPLAVFSEKLQYKMNERD